MKRSRRWICLALAIPVAAVAAGCSTSSGGGNASASVKAGAPIVLAGEGSLTGFTGAQDGVTARLKRANDAGGVDGHHINYLGITDNGASADTSLSTLRQLVQRKKVDAIVPEFPTVMPPSAAAFLKQQGVPFVGLGYESSMCNNTAGFPFNGCNVPGIAQGPQPALVKDMPKTLGKKDLKGVRLAIIGQDEAGAGKFVQEIAARAKDLGAQVVYAQAPIPAGATNVQAFADPVLASHPDIIDSLADLVSGSALQATLKANGYKGVLMNLFGYLPGIVDTTPELDKPLEGSWITTVIPTTQDNSPATKQMVADFAATKGKVTFGSVIAYEATDMYLALLAKAGGDPAKVIKTGSAGFTWTQLPGGFKTSFPAARTKTTECAGMVRLLNAKYQLVSRFSCIG